VTFLGLEPPTEPFQKSKGNKNAIRTEPELRAEQGRKKPMEVEALPGLKDPVS
jgi:hypothetical protein